MKITITLKNGKYLINDKPYTECNEIEQRCFNETVKAIKLNKGTSFELTINNYR